MGPKKHKHISQRFALGFIIAISIGTFFGRDYQEFFVFLSLAFILLGSLYSMFVKAKCDKCTSKMIQDCQKTHTYRCPKCGWIYDTGDSCDGCG